MAGDAGGSGAAASDGGASAASGAAPPASEQRHGFRDYGRVLREHRHFRYLWIAETVDNVGSWLVGVRRQASLAL